MAGGDRMAKAGKKPKEAKRRTLFASERADEVRRMADLRSTDRVLDVGCASGRIALEIAPLVGHVHGIDIDPARIEEAVALAEERGVENATFETASIFDYPLEPMSWDVTLFMAVWDKSDGERTVGGPELARILAATRRQLLMRAGVQRYLRTEPRLQEILHVCDGSGFDALCFSRPEEERVAAHGNVIVANRWGSDAAARELPPLTLYPTAMLANHPVVATARLLRS
jgi:SAM-dependent methyltransferase